MGGSTLEQSIISVPHGFRLSAAKHHLKVYWFEACIFVAMNHPCRSGNALPRTETRRYALTRFIFNKDIEKSLQHEKHLFHFVRMCCVPLTRLDIHNRQSEVSGRDKSAGTVFAGSTGANKPMLRPLESLDFCVLERRPIRLPIPEASYVSVIDLLDGHILKFFRASVSGNSHLDLLSLCACEWSLVALLSSPPVFAYVL